MTLVILGGGWWGDVPDGGHVVAKDSWSTAQAPIANGPQGRFHVPDDVALIAKGTDVDVLANFSSREELTVADLGANVPDEPSVLMATKLDHDSIGMKRR